MFGIFFPSISAIMLSFVLTLAALLNISVKCDIIKIIEGDMIQEFSQNDYNITKMFSTMSPYYMQENCKAVKTWIMMRHGAKWPSEDILSQINDELVPLVQKTVKQVYEIPGNDNDLQYSDVLRKNQKLIIRSIIKWKNKLHEGTHKDLNDLGRKTMTDLGTRLKQKLKPLADVLTKDNIEVISAHEWRCVLSAKKFLKTFFRGDYDDIDIKRTKTDERLELIKPTEDEVKVVDPENPGVKLCVETLFYKQNCSNIRKRIQILLFPDFITNFEIHRKFITDEMVLIIYYACAHSYYYLDDDGFQLNSWCWLFEYGDLKMFEEMHDLQYYYKNGYYLKNNEKMGNPLVNDLLKFLESPSEITFKMFVGHTSNCLSFITRFGLFRDPEPLTVDSIKQMTDRKWKTSYIAPFGCNIMVVIYDCMYTKFRVSIYLNEKPIKMVLPNGDRCVKCLLDDVVQLIKSFNTEERLTPTTNSSQNEEKAKRKEEKARIKEQQKANVLLKRKLEILNQRLEEVFDEDEEYWDTGKKSTMEATSSSGGTL